MKYLDILLCKIRLDLLSQIRYRIPLISDIVVLTVLFVIFIVSDTGKSFQTEYGYNYKSLVLIGYIVWTMAINAIATLPNYINYEARNGTLQYILNSVFPIEWTMFTVFISSQIINFFVIIILITVANFIFHINIFISINMLIPIILCLIGMFGIGLMVAGLSILIKRVSSLILFLQLMMLFITDTVPTNQKFLFVTKYIPLTMTNEIIRKIIAGKEYIDKMPLLVVSSITFFILGIILFRILLKLSIRKNIALFY